ncbi:hypothetical protein [Massilia orientalis]|uniref:Uncharacterized protein n=1 Tax=Massilia orientalis TaxID=3050128 RepID=A0ACC7MDD7_9BURK|nr:hypothetical protein [Massilia sp. YIM B02787]
MKPKMPNDAYVAIARSDNTWREIVASFAIEEMIMTEENEIIAGRMIAKEIDVTEALAIIRANAFKRTNS